MVTDLSEVFRLGTEKADENVAFRRYLSAHHAREAPFQIIATEIQKEIDCTACANCCRHSIVSVTESEIRGIAEYMGSSVDEVRAIYTDPERDAPALRKLKSAPEGGCVFLDTSNLCMIYEVRPVACRDFPHVAVGSHSLGGRPASHDRWASLCPIIYNSLEAYKHVSGYHPKNAVSASQEGSTKSKLPPGCTSDGPNRSD